MEKMQRGWALLNEEDRDECIKEIIAYFLDERGETIGVIAAESILDFLLQSAGPDIYNKAIEDARQLLKAQMEGVDVEFDLLKKQK